VADELITNFEDEYKVLVIASGNSMMEVLMEFEQVNDLRKDLEMEVRPVKYKDDV
jgi:hypothetical protein